MKIFERLANRRRDPTAERDRAEPGGGELPIAGYDRLDPKQVRTRLSTLSQVELVAIESHELSHQARSKVLNRLRWLKGSEPVPGYDALETKAIVTALSSADAATLKEVRDYERRHRDRHEIRTEVDRVLPMAPLSAQEDRDRDEQAGRVQAGLAGREKAAGSLAARRTEEPK